MNYSIILNILGWVLSLQGVFMLPPCLVGIIYKEHHDALVYFVIGICCFLIGTILRKIKTKSNTFYAVGFMKGTGNAVYIDVAAEEQRLKTQGTRHKKEPLL